MEAQVDAPGGQAQGARPPPGGPGRARRDRRRRCGADRRAAEPAGGRRPRRRRPDAARRCPASSSSAQEDLRREIARAMHDGPAQSLTNIVLQAQIVERLAGPRPGHGHGRAAPARRDGPADAGRDQDLHLRRPADGARRPGPGAHAPPRRPATAAGAPHVPVEFESLGQDRRLPMDVESARLPDPGRGAGRVPRARPRSGSSLRARLGRTSWRPRLSASPDRRPTRRRRAAAEVPDGRRAGRDQADDPGPPRRARDAAVAAAEAAAHRACCRPPSAATSPERAAAIGATRGDRAAAAARSASWSRCRTADEGRAAA